MEDGAKECLVVGSLDPFPVRALSGVIASRMKCSGVRGSNWGTRETDLKEFLYRKMLHADEVGECFVLKKLELVAREMLWAKVLRKKITLYDSEQWKATDGPQRADAVQRTAAARLE